MMPRPAPPKTAQNTWFEERRQLFLKNMLKGFYETSSRFLAIADRYDRTGKIPFAHIDGLVGTETHKGLLWTLKDRCHQLWRNADPQDEMNGCLLDWLMGSIFHEAMKLKENIYLHHVYGPLAEAMKRREAVGTVTLCGEEYRRFLDRVRREVESQMDNLGFMFGRANALLRVMVRHQGENRLLVRYLVENPEVVEQLWSVGLDDLLFEMFPEGAEYGYCAAARSYMEGDWHRRALAAYQKALAVSPACEEAQRHVHLLRALWRDQQQNGPASRNGN